MIFTASIYIIVQEYNSLQLDQYHSAAGSSSS